MTAEMREATVIPEGMIPGRNGGYLKRGGGRGGLTKDQAEFYRIIREKSPELGRKLIQLALKGNVQAVTLALSYAVGKPTERLELSGPDGGPLEFSEAQTDHEKRLLRNAILQELERVEEAGLDRDAIARAIERVPSFGVPGGIRAAEYQELERLKL